MSNPRTHLRQTFKTADKRRQVPSEPGVTPQHCSDGSGVGNNVNEVLK